MLGSLSVCLSVRVRGLVCVQRGTCPTRFTVVNGLRLITSWRDCWSLWSLVALSLITVDRVVSTSWMTVRSIPAEFLRADTDENFSSICCFITCVFRNNLTYLLTYSTQQYLHRGTYTLPSPPHFNKLCLANFTTKRNKISKKKLALRQIRKTLKPLSISASK